MTKRYDDGFLRMCDGVFLDACTLDPTLRKGFDRDRSRLESLLQSNGLPVYMIWLPALDKALCRALDERLLPVLSLPLSGSRSNKSRIPKLFQGIWMKLFDDDGCLRQDVDPTYVLFLRQLLAGMAKHDMKAPEAALYATTEAFFEVESRLPPTSHIWDGDGSDLTDSDLGSLLDLDPGCRDLLGEVQKPSPRSLVLLDTCQRLADIVATSFGEFFPEEAAFRHGPGATAEFQRGGGYKYSFPVWARHLEWRFPWDDFGTSNAALLGDISQYAVEPSRDELASRLIAVPKTHKAPRLIAAEPDANQWCQQAMLDFFLRVIAKDKKSLHPSYSLAIDFARQELSGTLALDASRDCHLATVDLKEASDRLSCWLIQRFWRRNISVLSGIVACRTRYIRNDIDQKFPNVHKLRKFATMGSALTFPLQSLAFLVICIASGLVAEMRIENRGRPNLSKWRELCKKVRVYGDDLIVPVSWMQELEELMPLLGLRINADKTFKGSTFRESCGVDAFMGYDVTPVKVKRFPSASKPSTVISVIDTCNLLFLKGMWHTADSLRRMVKTRNIGLHHVSDGIWGDVSFTGRLTTHLKERWSSTLHRKEYLMVQPKAKHKRSRRFEGAHNLLQFFTEDPALKVLSDWKSGQVAVDVAGICRVWVPYDSIVEPGGLITTYTKDPELVRSHDDMYGLEVDDYIVNYLGHCAISEAITLHEIGEINIPISVRRQLMACLGKTVR